jgi:hypothetical protein
MFTFHQEISYLEWYRYKLPALLFKRPYTFWHLLGVFVTLGLLLTLSKPKEQMDTLLLAFQMGVIFAWLYNIYFFFQQIDVLYNGSHLLQQKTLIVVNDSGLRYSNQFVEIFLPWASFKKTANEKLFLVLLLSNQDTILIKKEALQSMGQLDQITQFIQLSIKGKMPESSS